MDFPNPQEKWRSCGRFKPSFVCDPDFVLGIGEADKLDRLAVELKRTTSCICNSCSKEGGISVGIYLKKNLTQSYLSHIGMLAENIRETWHLGYCDDDIVIIAVAQGNVSGFSMGPEVQAIIPRSTALKIYNDCKIHFENGYFYQGLESMVNSFNDVLRRLQKPDKSSTRGLIIGAALGTGVFLILIFSAIMILRNHALRKRRKNTQNSSHYTKNLGYKKPNYRYRQPKAPTSSDEDENSSSDDLYNHLDKRETPFEFLPSRRHLSDVPEETSEEATSEALSFILSQPVNSNRSLEVTEL